ncbi:zinc ABC transporter substrate-binding protein [Alcanivorax sp. S6407]|uniref:metal ABC transporter substrate-binding protein n=1 Tax=Alcanivorax sp. S6407 TaxID=2926424 RepID=UPI001FF6C4F1|nr:zinc ABC transporter substrate-binding protein [Alcanivorax sp. S6407]MCK0153455.1 zinc ABC transporter substrate-binding protein [Alcanivorax sp. S6407]
MTLQSTTLRVRGLLIAALCAASFSAHADLRILACEPEWGQLATEIGGDLVTVKTASAPGQDAHHIQARPSLLAQVRRADMVLCTGAGLETGWLPVLLNRGGNPDVRQAPGLFMAAEQVDRLEIPVTLDRADGDVHAMGNPHVHMDPRRVITISQQLAERFATLDPDHADRYRQQQQAWQAALEPRVDAWEKQAASLKGLKVISYHRTWAYLLDWLEMTRVDELEPKPGLPPTPGHLASLVDKAGKEQVGLILYQPINGDKAPNWLASRTAACAVELPFSPGEEGTDTLTSLYDTLIQRLTHALQACEGGKA